MKPWQVKSWVIPTAGAEFVCAMEAVLDVYERPYDIRYPVVCLDETRKQLLRTTREGFIDSHGAEYIDFEYERAGVAEVYMLTEPLAGRREVLVKPDHSSRSYAEVLVYLLEKMYPDCERLTLIEDNLSAHRLAALYEICSPQRARSLLRRLQIVRTPVHGSWLNIAEIELSVLSRQCLKQYIGSKEELQTLIQQWYTQRTHRQVPVNWQFTTEDARIKLKRLYPPISG